MRAALKEEVESAVESMCFIQKDGSDIMHDSTLITQEFKTFYENVYASRENNIMHRNIHIIYIYQYHKKRVTIRKDLPFYKKHCHLSSK